LYLNRQHKDNTKDDILLYISWLQ